MPHLPWLILLIAYGACIGSFLNVVIYRLPAGKSLIRPGSHCPRCQHALAWYDNIPILAWLWLRARCRYCGLPISVQYPVVEGLCAVLFGALFYGYYESGLRPDFMAADLAGSWPVLLAHLVLLSGLFAATAIDARWYVIPLSIPNTIALAAILLLPAAAAFLPAAAPLCPQVSGRWAGAAAGGLLGMAVANFLLWRGVLPYSFLDENVPSEMAQDPPADPPPAEAKGSARQRRADAAAQAAAAAARRWRLLALAVLSGLAIASAVFGDAAGAAAALILAWLGVLPLTVTLDEERLEAEDANQWLEYPHPRREVLKEARFALFPLVGAVVGYFAMPPGTRLPVPLEVAAGVIFGYLVGGGAVWFTRIAGTLGFGKEAMGLGDVHLLAAIGAVLGWKDTGIIFFGAPFLGVAAALLGYGISRLARGQVRLIPYGPYLAAAAVLMMLYRVPIWTAILQWIGSPGSPAPTP